MGKQFDTFHTYILFTFPNIITGIVRCKVSDTETPIPIDFHSYLIHIVALLPRPPLGDELRLQLVASGSKVNDGTAIVAVVLGVR